MIRKELVCFVFVFVVFAFAACTNDQAGTKASSSDSVGAVSSEPAVPPASPPSNFKHATAKVNGVNIHYVIGGTGEPLVLIHGFSEFSGPPQSRGFGLNGVCTEPKPWKQ